VIDTSTLRGWIEAIGYDARPEGPRTLRIHPRAPAAPLPPFFVQVSENWIVLSMLPMLSPGAYRAEDLGRRLLLANRDMRLAKFALDENGAVVLCAELPTESLDASEIASAVTRMEQYARHFLAEFVRRRGAGVPA
jgi:hypothetical protein